MDIVVLQPVTQKLLSTLDWEDQGGGWVRIVADITCARCGAYQAIDSDPVQDKEESVKLSLRLLNHVGWRVDAQERPLCPDCARIVR